MLYVCTYICALCKVCNIFNICLMYCTVLYCTVLYCTVLYCTVLYCTVLYCKCVIVITLLDGLQRYRGVVYDWQLVCVVTITQVKVPLSTHYYHVVVVLC